MGYRPQRLAPVYGSENTLTYPNTLHSSTLRRFSPRILGRITLCIVNGAIFVPMTGCGCGCAAPDTSHPQFVIGKSGPVEKQMGVKPPARQVLTASNLLAGKDKMGQ